MQKEKGISFWRATRTASILGCSLFAIACSQKTNTSVNSQNLLSQEELATENIIGGQDASGVEIFAKHIVSVVDKKRSTICTGSIIAADLVLTAAHCLSSEPEDIRVVFGTDITVKEKRIILGVEDFVVPSTWVERNSAFANRGDIGILRLIGELPPGYEPIAFLPESNKLKKGQSVLLAGYGLTETKPNRNGAGVLRFVEAPIEDPTFAGTEVVVNQKAGHGACHGDSGGPAYVKEGNTLYLWGITSRGFLDPDDTCTGFSIYTNTQAYQSFLEKAAWHLRNPSIPPAT